MDVVRTRPSPCFPGPTGGPLSFKSRASPCSRCRFTPDPCCHPTLHPTPVTVHRPSLPLRLPGTSDPATSSLRPGHSSSWTPRCPECLGTSIGPMPTTDVMLVPHGVGVCPSSQIPAARYPFCTHRGRTESLGPDPTGLPLSLTGHGSRGRAVMGRGADRQSDVVSKTDFREGSVSTGRIRGGRRSVSRRSPTDRPWVVNEQCSRPARGTATLRPSARPDPRRPDPTKRRTVQEWPPPYLQGLGTRPTPTTVTEESRSHRVRDVTEGSDPPPPVETSRSVCVWPRNLLPSVLRV